MSILFQFGSPEFQFGFGKTRERAFRIWVAMPEAAVDKNYLPATGEDEIGFSGKVGNVAPKFVTGGASDFSHQKFRRCILAADKRHSLTALAPRKGVRHSAICLFLPICSRAQIAASRTGDKVHYPVPEGKGVCSLFRRPDLEHHETRAEGDVRRSQRRDGDSTKNGCGGASGELTCCVRGCYQSCFVFSRRSGGGGHPRTLNEALSRVSRQQDRVPQRLKPQFVARFSARLKRCPDGTFASAALRGSKLPGEMRTLRRHFPAKAPGRRRRAVDTYRRMGLKFSRWAVPASLVGLMILLGGCSSSGPSYNQTPAISAITPSEYHRR